MNEQYQYNPPFNGRMGGQGYPEQYDQRARAPRQEPQYAQNGYVKPQARNGYAMASKSPQRPPQYDQDLPQKYFEPSQQPQMYQQPPPVQYQQPPPQVAYHPPIQQGYVPQYGPPMEPAYPTQKVPDQYVQRSPMSSQRPRQQQQQFSPQSYRTPPQYNQAPIQYAQASPQAFQLEPEVNGGHYLYQPKQTYQAPMAQPKNRQYYDVESSISDPGDGVDIDEAVPISARDNRKPMYKFQDPPQQNIPPLEINDIQNEEEWQRIQAQLDREYQRKLKEVNDEAMKKLESYREEHQQLSQRAQTLYRSASRADSRPHQQSAGRRSDSRSNASQMSNLSFLSQPRNSNAGRNRFFTPRAIDDIPPVQEPEPVVVQEEKTEAMYIKEFYKEFCSTVKASFRKDQTVYLVDVLEKLNFLDRESIKDDRSPLCQLLRKHGQNLMLHSKSGEYSGESEDIIKNLFKVCCGIQKLRLAQRGHNQLDDGLLNTYINSINFTNPNPDFIIMDQLNTIKSLVNRKAYMLNIRQIDLIHEKFSNFFLQRKTYFDEIESERLRAQAQIRQRELEKQKMKQQPLSPKIQTQRKAPVEQPMPVPIPPMKEEIVYQYKPVSRQVRQPQALQKPQVPQLQPQVLHQQKQALNSYRPSPFKEMKPIQSVRPNYEEISASQTQRQPIPQKRPWSGARPVSRSTGSNSRAEQEQRYNFNKPNIPQANESPTRFSPKQMGIQNEYDIPQTKRAMNPSPPKTKQLYGIEQPSPASRRKSSSKQPSPPKVLESSFGKAKDPDEEPICVLKIELDGEHAEEIKVFENDDPAKIVEQFGQQFNLSDNAKRRLLQQIQEQIAADDESFQQ